MNKKNLRLLIFIGIAISAVVIMYFLSTPPPPPIVDIDNPGSVKEFKALCDSLKNSNWKSGNYKKLKGQLQSLRSQNVIGKVDGINLEEYLNLSYAQSLQQACKEWMDSDGNSIDLQLLREVEAISLNSNCTAFVADGKEAMYCYQRAIAIPNRVNQFIKKRYDENQYNALINDINKNCGHTGISHFANLRSIISIQVPELNKFKTFGKTFESRNQFYENNKTDPGAIDYLRELCPTRNPDINKYDYYLGEIQLIPGAC